MIYGKVVNKLKQSKYRLLMVMTLCIGSFLLLFISAFAADRKIVNIGFYEAPRYSYQINDGSFSGANIEYAYRISQKAGWGIKIKLFENEEEMLTDLENGTVDMLFDFGKTEEREAKYLFSENQIGSAASTIYVKNNDDRFSYGNVSQLMDKVYGYDAGNNVANLFINWCKNHGFEPQLREYKNTEEVDKALDRSEIDAGIISQNGHEGYTTILTFSPQPYYIIFRKQDSDLKNKVDSAMNQILINEPFYEEKLLEKYNITASGILSFSAEEKQYLSSHPTISVAVVKNDSPYYMKSSDGSEIGIIPDYYKKLEEFIGFSVSFKPYDSTLDAIAAIKDGKADVLAMFSDGIITAENDGILLTDAYKNVESVLLTRAGMSTDDITKIAVKERSVNNVKESISSVIHAAIVPVANAEVGFEALKNKKVDAIVCGLPTATWILNHTNASAYSTSVFSFFQFDLCGAVAMNNSILASILDKAIGATNYGFNEIVENNTKPENTWLNMISRIPPIQIVEISAGLIVIILLLILALISLIKDQKEKALISAAKAENERKHLQLEAIEKNAEEKNKFFSDLSHDMRTPLTAILGFSDLIAAETDITKIKEENKKVKASGSILLDLVNDSLTLSKIGNDKLVLHPEAIDIEHLFDPVITPIQVAAEKKNLSFTVDRSHVLQRTVLADPLYVRKILLNLLSNAVKYTQKGGKVELIIKDEPENSSDPDSVIIVKDNGIGMSEEFQSHMYEPFTQERRTGYGGIGTGLGLSIVKQLVELMGGTIEVQSQKNKGSVFIVRFHFKKVEVEKTETKQEDLKSVNYDLLNGKKILLCEDNALNQEIVGTLLKAKGISITFANNGKIGVQKFSESQPGEFSAILMDIRMPIMDGLDAARQIRKLNRSDAQSIPIIAMTADAFTDDIQKCFDSGMNGHIAKPIDQQKLFSVLLTIFQKK